MNTNSLTGTATAVAIGALLTFSGATTALATTPIPDSSTELRVIVPKDFEGDDVSSGIPTDLRGSVGAIREVPGDNLGTDSRLGAPVGRATYDGGPSSDIADTCHGDLDRNGVVNFGDLRIVLGSFGLIKDSPADLDSSGEVDFGDVITILTAWGSCG